MVVENTISKNKNVFTLGFCLCGCGQEFTLRNKMHYLRRFVHGHNKGNCNGGRHYDKDGYILILSKSHPRKNSKGYVRQHILIYEHYLSILFDEDVYIPKGQEIHHLNGKKDDNTLINLTCMTHTEHSRFHMQSRYRQNTVRHNESSQARLEFQ